MLRIALTGGIASGKSTVAGLFEDLGVRVIHTDEIAREVVAPGSRGLDEVVSEFGNDVLDAQGALDRPALRRRIFSDHSARRRLERILHPLIGKRVDEVLAEEEASGADYAIVEIPLLVETDAARHYDRVLVVDCDPAVQKRRVMQRDGMDAEAAERALAAQASREERLAVADDVIDNTSASQAELEAAVADIDSQYRAGAQD